MSPTTCASARWNLFFTYLAAAIGLLIAGLLSGSFWSLAGLSLATIGFYGMKTWFWPLPSTFLSGYRGNLQDLVRESAGNRLAGFDPKAILGDAADSPAVLPSSKRIGWPTRTSKALWEAHLYR